MKWVYLSLVIMGLLFVGGCTIPTPCAPSEMGIAGNMHPSGYALVSLSPSLTWEYPSSAPSPYPYPSGSSDCAISGYQIYLAEFNDQYHDLGGSVSGAASNSFTPSSPLAPATTYFWEVKALSSSGPGPWSGKHAFVTGPVCDVPSLPAPYAYSPSGTIHTLRPAFIWWGDYAHTNACMPSAYRFELSTEPGFGTTVAAFDAPDDPSYGWTGWTPDSDLLDCTDYYWRVAAKNASVVGPFANKSFRTQVGACPMTYIFIPLTNANCRIGPNPLYDRLTFLTPGDRLPVLARHQTADGMWYNLQLPDNNRCWAAEATGKFEGDPNGLPFSDDFPSLPEQKPGGEGEPPEPSVPPCVESPTHKCP
jgi:hypothetical protein